MISCHLSDWCPLLLHQLSGCKGLPPGGAKIPADKDEEPPQAITH